MLTATWTRISPSVCSFTLLRNDQRISSGTGFRVADWLITNDHVVQIASATHCTIRFVATDGYTTRIEQTFTMEDLRSRIRDREPAQSWDFAVLDLTGTSLSAAPPLTLSRTTSPPIGSAIALLGFQFENQNLALHGGLLSSKYVRAGVAYLQLDASVNQGNSGGPLIDPASVEVIGIVTRKGTGLTDRFDELLRSFQQNRAAFEKIKGMVGLGRVDLGEAMATTQTQLERTAVEIRRSANVGIGYAYELTRVRAAIDRLAKP